jgi:hypothetical protein
MDRRFGWFLSCALSVCLASGSAVAQGAKVKPVPRAETYVLPAAELLRVDEGVFEIPVDGTIDLTDRRIFLSIRSYREWATAPKKCCNLLLNGQNTSIGSDPVSKRFDLKQLRETQEFVVDKEQCFLDVVDVVMPKGAPWIATFRLHCL